MGPRLVSQSQPSNATFFVRFFSQTREREADMKTRVSRPSPDAAACKKQKVKQRNVPPESERQETRDVRRAVIRVAALRTCISPKNMR